jgi:hypothetical protein
MQQIRKPKRTGRQRMTAAMPARNRRSTEQMLAELKRRLREASDLTAAGDVLNWDQGSSGRLPGDSRRQLSRLGAISEGESRSYSNHQL